MTWRANHGKIMLSHGEVRFEEDRVVLHYMDNRGRPRTTLLMYRRNTTLLWISPHSNVSVSIGTVETDENGDRYLRIPVK